MKPKQDLFDLIHSLSPSEKRYFKVYASKLGQQKQKKYLLLFDKISQQSAYDETALLNAFYGYKFTKQFGVAKNYLFQLILRSLREYHSTRKEYLKIHNSLQEAQILEEKGLIQAANKMYQKAAEFAEKENKLMLAFEGFFRLEQLSSENATLSVNSPVSFTDKKEQLLMQIQKEDYYEKQHNLLVEYLRNPNGKEAPSKMDLSASLAEENIELESSSYFLFAKSAHLKLLSIVFIGNKDQILETCNNILKSFDIASIEENVSTETLKLLEQVGTALLYSDSHTFFYNNFFKKLSSICEKDSEEAVPQLEVIVRHLHLRYCILNAKWQQASNNVQRLKQLSSAYNEPYLTGKQKDEVSYDIAYMHFINGDFNEALKWLVSFTTRDIKNEMDDTTIYGHILALLSHFESSHFQVLGYLHRQTIAMMQKSRKLYEYELFFLNYMRTIKKFTTYENRYSFYSTLQKRLTHAQESRIKAAKDEMLFSKIDFLAWVESKIKQKKLSDILPYTNIREYSVAALAPSDY